MAPGCWNTPCLGLAFNPHTRPDLQIPPVLEHSCAVIPNASAGRPPPGPSPRGDTGREATSGIWRRILLNDGGPQPRDTFGTTSAPEGPPGDTVRPAGTPARFPETGTGSSGAGMVGYAIKRPAYNRFRSTNIYFHNTWASEGHSLHQLHLIGRNDCDRGIVRTCT